VWAWAVLHAKKDVENRSWFTSYRGPLGIHASASLAGADDDAEKVARISGADVPLTLECGALIGVVDLTDCIRTSLSRWASPGTHHFELRNARLCKPIDVKGKLGFWEFPDGKIIFDK
jgi:hypothetical protein